MDKPVPVLDDLNAPYWEGARQGRLRLQRCDGCGLHQFYPRPFCLRCSSDQLTWVEASGRGRLHTFSVVHRTADAAFADDVPYVFGVVELEEGPRLTVNVVDTPPPALRCDLDMRIVFTEIAPGTFLPNARADV
jgi:uncharacterized protein